MLALAAVIAATLVLAPVRLRAQDNTLDLRFLELDNKGNVTYQNFIYARMIDSSRWMAQALYLRLPSAGNYGEYSAGVGYRVASVGGFTGYVVAGGGHAMLAPGVTANYFEPAFSAGGTEGKWAGSFFLQRYVQADANGSGAWLIDPLEFSYNVAGPFALGLSFYAYHPDEIEAGPSLTKLGVKFGLNDKLGTSEVRISTVNTTQQPAGMGNTTEFQFRRVFVF